MHDLKMQTNLRNIEYVHYLAVVKLGLLESVTLNSQVQVRVSVSVLYTASFCTQLVVVQFVHSGLTSQLCTGQLCTTTSCVLQAVYYN